MVDRQSSGKSQPNDDLQFDGQTQGQRPLPDDLSLRGAPSKEHVASIGGLSKKRVAKAVGEEDVPKISESTGDGSHKTTKKPKVRKGKRIKLSFDEDAGSSVA